MKKIIFGLQIILCVGLLSTRPVSAEGKKGRKPPSRAGSPFPAYPRAGGNAKGPHLSSHPDSLGNRVTQDHLNRVDFASQRADHQMKHDPRVTEQVNIGRARFANEYRHEFDHKVAPFDGYLHHYNAILIDHPHIIDLWRRHFIFGGFYYGFHPIVEIDAYFYNPLVYWFYVPTYNDYYYRNWYQASYDAYPQLHHPFDYPGLYFPTENLRQLLFGVSAMSVDRQLQFRTAISLFTKKIAQALANHFGTHVRLAKGDVVLTHYEVLGYDDAVALEGFVNFSGISHDFKGLLDLRQPDQTVVIAPIALEVAPTTDQIKNADELSSRISVLRGEPLPAPPPVESQTATPAGEISADPEGGAAAVKDGKSN